MKESREEIFAVVKQFFEEQVPFNRLLGMRMTALEKGFARMEIPYREDLIGDPTRPALHGGALAALLDTAGGAAAFSLTNTVEDRVSTIDMRIDFMRPGQLLGLIAEARVTRMGSRVTSVDGLCFHPGCAEEPIASMKGVYSVRRATGKGGAVR
jgi:uncharacterized protein (TIGR00369 family)